MALKDTIEDIRSLKIQGAQNIALAAVLAIKKFLDESIFRNSDDLINKLNKTRKIFFEVRPTEPAMRNAINYILDIHYISDFASLKEQILERVKEVQKFFIISEKKINIFVDRKLKNSHTIFTHCHSSTVTSAIIYSFKQGKKIEVNNTETRPFFQGRKTAIELAKKGIKVNHFIDSAAKNALKRADFVLIGCDAILSTGEIVNKIGTEYIVEIAKKYDIPVYVCTNSWKFDPLTIKGYEEVIEERSSKEVWPKAPLKNIKIQNPIFEIIGPELITGIISELGIYPPMIFVEELRREHPWIFE
ncbi:MAG: S-methyl-5-thioribose-1-phosphate isomerase [Sulfurovaceae bacterium]|nr:S-methyl-5-thioribose-1-phosphate isomerase [Sulfurovaceae bacterium]